MTKHTPIPGAPQQGKRRGSLLERADAAFGLEKLGGAKVPGNLPRPDPRKVQAPPQQAEEPHVGASETATPVAPAPEASPSPAPNPAAPEARVRLSGPSVEIHRDALRASG
ncbi:MAG: hypothetical protein AAFO28_04455, partial [Pseudomonadota bacterium]